MSQICKFFVLASILCFFVTGCNDSTGDNSQADFQQPAPEPNVVPAPDAETNSQPKLPTKDTQAEELTQKVSAIEDQLKDYGVHFVVEDGETDESQSNTYSRRFSYGQGNQHYRIVTLKTTATDDDLTTLGRKAEDRDRLFGQLSDLAKVVASEGLRDFNDETNLAITKIDLTSSKIVLPMMVGTYADVLKEKSNRSLFNFSNDDQFQMELWDLKAGKSISLTNGEAIQNIDYSVGLNSKFNLLKTNFLKNYIERQIDVNEVLKARDPWHLNQDKSREDLVRDLEKIQSETFLSDQVSQLALALKTKIASLPSADKLNPEVLSDLNNEVLVSKRVQLLSAVENELNSAIHGLKLEFADNNQIDAKSLAEARVQNADFSSEYANGESRVRGSQNDYLNFVRAYKDHTSEPDSEKSILSRAEAFSNLYR